ncbi:MAG: S8 family serine peptidase [Mycobacteriales bacterium]
MRRVVITAFAAFTLAAAGLPVLAAPVSPPPATVRLARATLPTAQANPYRPHRPASCPPVPNDPNTATAGQPSALTGVVPWPPLPPSGNPIAEAAADRTPTQSPPVRPANWALGGGNWKLTSARSSQPALANNPQELCGVRGNSVDTAWQVSTGSPQTVIAVTDSGIEWCDPGIVNKIYLNRGALPEPENAAGQTKPQLIAAGVRFRDNDPYDLLDSGVFNVAQYAADPRVAKVAADYGGLFCAQHAAAAGYSYHGISPEDLIRTFGRPTLPGGAANPYYLGRQSPSGFTEAIAGWNFLDNSNDPYDDVHYDHGTGEAEDSTGAAGSLGQEVGACPNCMILPVRVGDSFIASASTFAEGVLFAVDSGANVIQEALGTLDVTRAAQQAIDYANAHGVPVVASAADEEAQHHNEPANLMHTIVVNSITQAPRGPNGLPEFQPGSYLYLNGCTNYGANIALSVESASCSSEATGKTGGVVGLAESAAHAAMASGVISAYPGVSTVSGAPVPLSANELRQLITMSASDVNFATAAPPFPPDNYGVIAPVPTTRYPTTPGFDIYTGYGRLDAARMLDWIAAGDIPPQAEILDLPWFETFSPNQTMSFHALVGTPRPCPGSRVAKATAACPWRYQLQIGAGPAPGPSGWHTVASGAGQGVRTLDFHLPMNLVGTVFPLLVQRAGFTGGPVGVAGRPAPNKFTFTTRIVVQDVGPGPAMVGITRRAESLHADPSLLPGFPRVFAGSIDAAPTLAPLGPHGQNVLLVATADGTVHAFTSSGAELPGWPVHTVLDSGVHLGEAAYRSGAVQPPRAEIINIAGGLAVGDLANASGHHLDVVATDYTGRVYAWNAHGRLLPGFPVRTDAAFSGPAVRDPHNRVLRGIDGAAALAPLQGSRMVHGRRVTPLDIVVAALDRHVYAWEPNGAPVPGWPVLTVDPREVSSVNPKTNRVHFAAGSNVTQGSKLDDTPAIGNLVGTGPPDVVVGASEEYLGTPNYSVVNPITSVVGQGLGAIGLQGANSRLYAIYPNGALHPAPKGAADPPGFPNPGAFLPGWPAAIADLDPSLLPDVGDGITNSPALAEMNGRTVTGVISAVGPGYLLNPDGSSALGTGPDGKPVVFSTQPTGAASNSVGAVPSLPALGGPSLAPLGGLSGPLSFLAPALSLGKALDVALPADQHPHDNQVDAWSTANGHFQPGFPQVMGDLQFFDQPLAVNLPGPGGPYVVEASATSDLRAVNALGQSAVGFPKYTGGWVVNSPAVGAFGTLASQVLAVGTREGQLFVWSTGEPACASPGPWPMAHHDLWNTNNLSTPPALLPKATCAPQ